MSGRPFQAATFACTPDKGEWACVRSLLPTGFWQVSVGTFNHFFIAVWRAKAAESVRVHMKTITSPSISLPDAEKLNVLRRLDQLRQWHSLDDKRYCLVCGKIITGHQIQVAGGTRGNGALRLSCPSERCNSIPMDWMLPTDEILARVEMLAAKETRGCEIDTH
jgi:hypothetical protein